MMQQVSKKELKADFPLFVQYLWHFLKLPSPTWIQLDMARQISDESVRSQIITAYRGAGKSWITSAYVVWLLWNDPDHRVLVVSGSGDRSNQFSTFCHRLIIECPLLKHLEPTSKNSRWSCIAWDVEGSSASHVPSCSSVGITGSLVGKRGNTIIADDVETINNSMTQDMRDKLVRRIEEFSNIKTNEESRIIMLGTPQTQDSLYRTLRNERGYEQIFYTGRYPVLEELDVYNGDLAPIIMDSLIRDPEGLAGKPTDPMRFNGGELAQRETEMGKSMFKLQFMLDTTLSDAEKYPLKTNDWIVMSLDYEKAPVSVMYGTRQTERIMDIPNVGFNGDKLWHPLQVSSDSQKYECVLMAIDPSGRGADEMAYVIIGSLLGKYYVLHWDGIKTGYGDETFKALCDQAKRWNVNRIVTESNFGDGMFNQIFKPHLIKWNVQAGLEEVRSNQQKEKRIIDTCEPLFNQHRVVFNENRLRGDVTEGMYSLTYQLTHLNKERGCLRHDDRADALSIGLQWFIDQVGRSEEMALSEVREEAERSRLEKFLEGDNGKAWLREDRKAGAVSVGF